MTHETKWMLRHKETGLLVQMDRGTDFYTHDEGLATKFVTRQEAIKMAKKLYLAKTDFEVV